MKRRWILTLLVVVAAVAMYAGNVLATMQSGMTAVQVAKGQFDEIDLKAHTVPADLWQARLKTQGPSDLYVVRNTFAPGGQSGWHTHPGPSLITVTAGQITAYEGDDPTCTPKVYTVGQGFLDPGGDHVHLLRNETAAPAETVAVQIIPRDAPRRIDAEAPGNCSF
jgi:quercetin dioxygenase-like cupin family protein